MSTDGNKALVRRSWDELWNVGRLAVADELYAAHAVHHPSIGGPDGPEGQKQYVVRLRSAFPDLHFTVEDQIAEGDTVTTRLTVCGTHRGPFQGLAPTGRRATVSLMVIHRIADGQIVEAWSNRDDLGLRRQLGALP